MIYLSKPHGTYAVYNSRHSQGAYDVFRLVPGRSYIGGPPEGDFVGERDHSKDAESFADKLDLINVPHPCNVCEKY